MPEVTEKWSGRRGTFDYLLMRWVSTRVYEVAYCTDEFSARAALAALSPPVRLNSQHPLSKNLLCTKIDPVMTGLNFYTVTVTYTIPPGGDATSNDDPLQQPIKISWEPGTWSEASNIDAEGNPLVNMAGDPIDPQPMEWPTIQLVVKKNVAVYDPTQAVTYQGAINSDTFSISGSNINIQVPPGQCRCRGIRPESEYTLSATFNTIIARFDYRPNNTDLTGVAEDAWDLRILNQGYNAWYKDPATNQPQLGPLYFGQDKVTSPVPLDNQGMPVGAGYSVTFMHLPPVANPAPPIVNKNVWLEKQVVGSGQSAVTLYYLHYLRGKYLPFTGLV